MKIFGRLGKSGIIAFVVQLATGVVGGADSGNLNRKGVIA